MVELHKIALWGSFCPCNFRLARASQGHSFSIQCDGKDLRWKHILDLYYRNTWAVRSTPGLSLLPKLTFEHATLTSFSKIRVDLAAQVCGYVCIPLVFVCMSVIHAICCIVVSLCDVHVHCICICMSIVHSICMCTYNVHCTCICMAL